MGVQIMTSAATDASVTGATASLRGSPMIPPPVKLLEKLACEAAEQKWIEDKATDKICSMITKKLPISDCQAKLENMWDAITARCPKGLETSPPSVTVPVSHPAISTLQ